MIIPSSHFSAPPVTDDVPNGVTANTRSGIFLHAEFRPVLPTYAVYRQTYSTRSPLNWGCGKQHKATAVS